MASFRMSGKGWRAEIYVGGVRESAVFDEKFEAESWAKQRETELKMLKSVADNAKRVSVSKHRFLQNSSIYSEPEIVGTSTPIPQTSGVYFLIKGDTVVYVGQSNNVHRRIHAHMASKSFDKINVIECPPEGLTRLERQYIKKFNPVLNIVGGGSRSEVDLVTGVQCQAL